MTQYEDRASRPDVLVVDDDPRNRRLLEEYLATEAYAVRSAPDGNTALTMACERVPDLVLLDVMMPDLNGHEVCRRLKTQARTRHTQVMLVTALSGSAHTVEGLDEGADDYVSKPVRRDEFLAKVRSLLRARKLLVDLEIAREDLAARNVELEELEALKETLAQTLVHDLKNPLSGIIGNLDLLSRHGLPDDKAQTLVRRCQTGAGRMLRMILDLLDVAGLEERRLSLRRERVDANEIARKAAEEIDGAARPRGIEIRLEVAAACPAIDGDASVLQRVVDNLLANAVEHSPTGAAVRIRVESCDEGVRIDVDDQGSGIPAEHRERIFEKYSRLELRKAGISTNRGLGLTFCRLAVEAHGGAVWVEESPEGGARFRTVLPAYEGSGVIAPA